MPSFKLRPIAEVSILSILFFAAPLSSHADSQSIERSKIDAAAITRGMQGAFALDSSGNVVTNEDGSVRRGQGNAFTSGAASSLIQEITGVSGYQGLANPAARGGAAGAKAQLNGRVEFSCKLTRGSSLSAAGVSFKFHGCKLRDGRVESVVLQLCTKATNGGLCNAADFSEQQEFPVSRWSEAEGITIGVNCDDTTKRCLLSTTTEFSVAGNAEQIAQQASRRRGGEELRQHMRNTVESEEYADQQVAQQAVRDCYAENEASFLSDGKVKTCDGRREIAVVGGPSGVKCEPDRICLQQETTTQTFNTSCTRTYGLTTYSCNGTPKSFDCEATLRRRNGQEEWSYGCSEEKREGAVEVERTLLVECARRDRISGECIEDVYRVKYMDPDDLEYSNCEAKPFGLAGSFSPQTCAMGSNERELRSCGVDGWFNRTLSDEECTATETDENGNTVTYPLDESKKAGCGFCTKSAVVSFTCKSNEPPQFSCTDQELQGCALVNIVPENTAWGLTLSETWNYRCEKTRTSCLEWKVDRTSCPNIDGSYGVDQMAFKEVDGSAALSEALATAGLAEGLAQTNDQCKGLTRQQCEEKFRKCTNLKEGEPVPPECVSPVRLFDGEALTCEYPVGFGADWLSNNCCNINLTKTGGGKISNKCTENEVKLASARRNKYIVSLGEYCSSKTFWGACRKRRQAYCAFDGMLARIIQEQGRAQLNEAGRSLDSTENRTLQFDYYAGVGRWSPAVTANGVEIHVYQQPSYCADPELAAQRLARDPSAQECPATLDVWFAACTKAGGCGPLPEIPENGSERWQLTTVNPLQVMETAVANRAVVKGACDTMTARCTYEVSIWPAGSAGRATITRELSFDIFTTQPTEAVFVGDVLVQARPDATRNASGTLPTGVSAQFSTNNGTSWASFLLPTRITGEFHVPDTDVSVMGGCSELTGQCQYQFTGKVEIGTLSWGNAKNPQCQGFTLAQFSALDFSQMDLSEWTSTLDAGAPSESEIAALITEMVANAPRLEAGGNPTVSSNPSRTLASLQPARGIGPFDVKLLVPAQMPTNVDDPVHSVEVDWGDCTGSIHVSRNGEEMFGATHRYMHPVDIGVSGLCQNKPVTITDRALKHTVIVTVHASSGTYTERLEVINQH